MSDRDPIELSASAEPAKTPKLLSILVAANLLVTIAAVTLVALQVGPFAPQTVAEPAEGDEEVPAEDLAPAVYESMDKPLVANFPADGRDRYLQLMVQFMTRSDQTVLDVRNHMPAIVDAIYVLLGQTEFDSLQTVDGREELRQEVLVLTQAILERHTGETGVEQVFFTTFLFQT